MFVFNSLFHQNLYYLHRYLLVKTCQDRLESEFFMFFFFFLSYIKFSAHKLTNTESRFTEGNRRVLWDSYSLLLFQIQAKINFTLSESLWCIKTFFCFLFLLFNRSMILIEKVKKKKKKWLPLYFLAVLISTYSLKGAMLM